MTLTQLISLCRLKVPAAPADVISDDDVTLILNNAALEIARKTKCLPTYATFDTVADQIEYDLLSLISDYLCPLDKDLQRVYYYDGSNYEPLDIVTLGYLDKNHLNWQADDSADPERCVIFGDTLYLHPPASSAITDGILFYYCKKPQPMDATHPYPFGGASEIPRLTPYHPILVTYYEIEAYEILDKPDRVEKAKNKYVAQLKTMIAELRRDWSAMLLKSEKTRMGLPDYGQKYGQSMF